MRVELGPAQSSAGARGVDGADNWNGGSEAGCREAAMKSRHTASAPPAPAAASKKGCSRRY